MIIVLPNGNTRHFNLNTEAGIKAAERCKAKCENAGYRLVKQEGFVLYYKE